MGQMVLMTTARGRGGSTMSNGLHDLIYEISYLCKRSCNLTFVIVLLSLSCHPPYVQCGNDFMPACTNPVRHVHT